MIGVTPPLNPVALAARHAIVRDGPSPDFFEGAIMGNGGLGVIVCTRPDAIVLHFGHNNVWDQRIAEDHRDKVGTFAQIVQKMRDLWAAGGSIRTDSWFTEYCRMTREAYAKPYPRPFPCGTVALGFDRREAEMLGHRLDIATGVCTIDLLVAGRRAAVEIVVDTQADRVWIHNPAGLPIRRVHVLPDDGVSREHTLIAMKVVEAEGLRLPAAETFIDEARNILGFRQRLPFKERADTAGDWTHPDDRAFRLSLHGAALAGIAPQGDPLLHRYTAASPAVLCIQLDEGPIASIAPAAPSPIDPAPRQFDAVRDATQTAWRDYWSRSAVTTEDQELEAVWYRNLYFLHCAMKPGVTCPGLFGNWSKGGIGTAWHGDYHFNYNIQQPFWGTFSSNHVDKHLCYVDLVERVLGVAKLWARDYYEMRGAMFPHTAYPVTMNTCPYPVPTWGWEICETPWAVQSLWWHYLYTMDLAFLRDRAIGPIREAVLFLVDYLRRPDARGDDGRYHVIPTVAPELHGMTDHFKLNRDCLVDLTLIRFVMKAYLSACDALKIHTGEGELPAAARDVLDHLVDYPTAQSARGTVFVSVPGESPDIVQNTPNALMTVFPGEDHGLHSPPEVLALLDNTRQQQQNEGGNDLVFLNLQKARLGKLDLEQFKCQVRYCTIANGSCTDRVLQTGGRYRDVTNYDFMSRMGIWVENFALPAVINECLLQSYTGVIRLFPNWPPGKAAEFQSLRAVGGFLVSARHDEDGVNSVSILSEAGATLRLFNPWSQARFLEEERRIDARLIELLTHPGQRFTFVRGEDGVVP